MNLVFSRNKPFKVLGQEKQREDGERASKTPVGDGKMTHNLKCHGRKSRRKFHHERGNPEVWLSLLIWLCGHNYRDSSFSTSPGDIIVLNLVSPFSTSNLESINSRSLAKALYILVLRDLSLRRTEEKDSMSKIWPRLRPGLVKVEGLWDRRRCVDWQIRVT